MRIKPPARHKHITLVGDEGRLWRTVLIGAGVLALIIVLIVVSQPEPQLMSSLEIQSVEDRGILRVGVREGIPKLSDDGEGLEIALAKLLAGRMLPHLSGENAVKLVTVTSATAGARLDDASIDAALALLEKDASPKYLYSDAYYQEPARFLLPDGKASDPVYNVTVGCIQASPWMSSSSDDKLLSAGQKLLAAYIAAHPSDGIVVKTFASYDDLLTALQNGTVGAAVMTDLYIQKYSESYSFSVSPTELGNVEYAMAASTDSPAFIELFNLMLSEMKEDGSLAALYREYGLS
ncbi:MAG TPA: transporter substrate-binding domain-containing protein [Clostridia bacterium]|nr:transporter substrate-binding domain-containing protein [Clostridia bacterium]